MSIINDTNAYEAWLGTHCAVVADDIAFKHERMDENPFVFLRATYYRWARRIERLCPSLADAPSVSAVGDIHLENFGTWRDGEGRWVWGVNDFDEAAPMPYAFDLVRLAASVRLAPGLKIDHGEAADAILEGYGAGLAAPKPALLDEQKIWLRPYVKCSDRHREKFWKEIANLPSASPPFSVRNLLIESLPVKAANPGFHSRVAGGGSLGRPRYVVIADWRGGRVVREAKALVPSAWIWTHTGTRPQRPGFDMATAAYRAPDPFLRFTEGFIVRRLSADSRKIELGKDAGSRVKRDLLRAMGFDVGSVHAATRGARPRIEADLAVRSSGWLRTAARAAASATERDFERWRRRAKIR